MLLPTTHDTKQVPLMADSPKTRIFALAHEQNLSESFGSLLNLVAAMYCDGRPLVPDSEDERLSWAGYQRGLISALLCMAMHEQQCAPTAAALLVRSLLDQARSVMGTFRPEGEA